MRAEAECEADEPTPEGMWVDEDDTIYLGKWLSAKRKREVLFHELVHAVLDYREHVGDTHETRD
jgi:Zn-dependent peptidase ImmA (M78 family)